MNETEEFLQCAIAENKVLQIVNKVKESHNEPIATIEELHEILCKYQNMRNRILSLEMRFRKLTLTKIKVGCPLFRQMNITDDLKQQNLESLITSTLFCSARAEFTYLKNGIE